MALQRIVSFWRKMAPAFLKTICLARASVIVTHINVRNNQCVTDRLNGVRASFDSQWSRPCCGVRQSRQNQQQAHKKMHAALCSRSPICTPIFLHSTRRRSNKQASSFQAKGSAFSSCFGITINVLEHNGFLILLSA